ncbi:mog1/PsbP/DUF1795-like photosystem II reaction center PsbP family protein [Artemisia annua]|uniref:Mog1/PsbP/DUF1795-like photosystem II reaction center PsbP family protein n=1 Tax=Artemisia annua TaxID=35608 RepID=A0A2U1LJX6_ARTAN|nr:mog1/PsbP/DUF1795-like photosystem II reaction center PsbP family protein [Artemisia annua]
MSQTVSIADLGGTKIDLRFSNVSEGRISVIVAPVLRFAECNWTKRRNEVMNSAVKEYSGRKYYQFELEPPHCLITATAAGNRLYLFSILANGLQWKRHNEELKKIADSFRIVYRQI